eukprot:Skav224101  [mRNA]  locus=scaffold4565:153524:158382:- [translate_table: standard]
MFHGKPREAEVTSLRDAVARLERSRQRAEELARERAERAAEMQQEIVRLQAENQRLAARVRGEAFALEHNESMVDRIVEENRQLRADKERLLLEISRVGRDNQRLLKEARRPDPCLGWIPWDSVGLRLNQRNLVGPGTKAWKCHVEVSRLRVRFAPAEVSAEYGSGASHMNNSQANTAAKGVKILGCKELLKSRMRGV